VDWRDIDPGLGLLWDDMAGPGKLYALERLFWIELWRLPILEAVDENRIEARQYGPVRVFAHPTLPRLPLVNAVLGADRPGAVEDGRLAEALDWTESMGLNCRLPVRAGVEFGEAEAAEDHLNRRGYRRTGRSATFVRGLEPPAFQPPAGIEVEELVDESNAETFGIVLDAAYATERANHGFFMGLPGRHDWRAYLAVDETGPLAAAATMMHYEVPQLAFAGAMEETRGRGAHKALLHRRIEDVRAADDGRIYSGPQGIFAITEESLAWPDHLSPGACNLVHAGFRLLDVRTVWQPPEELIAGDEEDEEGEEEWGADDPDEDDDHTFRLEG
jgi:hypothetical protein